MEPLVPRYTNKRVDFAFAGEKLAFDLTHGLFSSFDIDNGTKLLLKTVAKGIDLSSVSAIADIGCGIGVIGVSLMKKIPGCRCLFQDRDALALSFSEANCGLNGIEGNAEFVGGLGLQALGDRRFNLVLSNLPAKAGAPVLYRILADTLDHLSDDGLAAVVVVASLAEAIGDMLDSLGCQVTCREETREHRVYLFRRGGLPPSLSDGDLEPYIRRSGSFTHGGNRYRLDTVYNLPDFDTLGRSLSLVLDLADKRLGSLDGCEGKVVIWNPGQGHPAVYLAGEGRAGLSAGRLVIASRDALQLAVTRHNLRAGVEGHLHVPSLDSLSAHIEAGSVSLVILLPELVSGVSWQEEAGEVLPRLLETKGRVLACSSSTQIHRFLSVLHGMVLHGNRKLHGSRAVLLEKSG